MTDIRESNTPRVSVLIAARNEARRVGDAVRSILDQTLHDLELIIADDGSTDDTPRVLRDLAVSDARIQLLWNKWPRGLAHSLNRCAEEARGEYLARMDADDISLPSRIEAQVRFLDSHPEVDILGTAANTVDVSGNITGTMPVESDHDRMANQIYRRNPFIHPTVMMRRAAFARLGGYDESLLRGQDYDLWLRARHACRFANLQEPFLLYRIGAPVRWESLLYCVRILCRSIRREGLPIWYYWFALRSILSVPLACCRRIRDRLPGV